MDIQSSPVPMLLPNMETPDDPWMCIPSVFGLVAEAEILVFSILVFWHPSIMIWNNWLFSDVNPLTTTLLEL